MERRHLPQQLPQHRRLCSQQVTLLPTRRVATTFHVHADRAGTVGRQRKGVRIGTTDRGLHVRTQLAVDQAGEVLAQEDTARLLLAQHAHGPAVGQRHLLERIALRDERGIAGEAVRAYCGYDLLLYRTDRVACATHAGSLAAEPRTGQDPQRDLTAGLRKRTGGPVHPQRAGLPLARCGA